MIEVWVFEYDDGDYNSSGAHLLEWKFYDTAQAAKSAAQDFADLVLDRLMVPKPPTLLWVLVEQTDKSPYWNAVRTGEEEFIVHQLEAVK